MAVRLSMARPHPMAATPAAVPPARAKPTTPSAEPSPMAAAAPSSAAAVPTVYSVVATEPTAVELRPARQPPVPSLPQRAARFPTAARASWTAAIARRRRPAAAEGQTMRAAARLKTARNRAPPAGLSLTAAATASYVEPVSCPKYAATTSAAVRRSNARTSARTAALSLTAVALR